MSTVDGEIKNEMVKTIKEHTNISVEFEEVPVMGKDQKVPEKPSDTELKIKSVTVSPANAENEEIGNGREIVKTVVKKGASHGYKIYKGVKPMSKFVSGPAGYVMTPLEAGRGSSARDKKEVDKQIARQNAVNGLNNFFGGK